VAVLLSRPQWAGGWLSPAVLVTLASAWFYLRLELRLGVLMSVLLGMCLWAGQVLAQQSTLGLAGERRRDVCDRLVIQFCRSSL